MRDARNSQNEIIAHAPRTIAGQHELKHDSIRASPTKTVTLDDTNNKNNNDKKKSEGDSDNTKATMNQLFEVEATIDSHLTAILLIDQK